MSEINDENFNEKRFLSAITDSNSKLFKTYRIYRRHFIPPVKLSNGKVLPSIDPVVGPKPKLFDEVKNCIKESEKQIELILKVKGKARHERFRILAKKAYTENLKGYKLIMEIGKMI
jgi:hypothetical protein